MEQVMDSCSSDSGESGGRSSIDSLKSRRTKQHTGTHFNTQRLVWSNQEFIYVGQECRSIPDSTAIRYGTSSLRLDLTFNNFSSLKFLHHFNILEELIMDNNQLENSIKFPLMMQLRTLSLNKNKITDLESLLDKINSSLPKLQYLSLLGNPACPNQLSCSDRDEEDYYRYRLRVIYRVPTLNFLDSSPIKNTERINAQRNGPFTRIFKPKTTSNIRNDSSDDSEEEAKRRYTPLPVTPPDNGDHKGAYGICRYKYLGLHSEGNRFIRNNDL